MSQKSSSKANIPESDFTRASEEKPLSLSEELWFFVQENKKWWLIPILLVLGAVGLLVTFGTTGAAPFIYTLF